MPWQATQYFGVSQNCMQQFIAGTGTYRLDHRGDTLVAYAGCLQLLEILEISLNLYGSPGNFCAKCR